jgi:hypothetical protein
VIQVRDQKASLLKRASRSHARNGENRRIHGNERTIFEPIEGWSLDEHELRINLLMEALHVRGEGFQTQIQGLAEEVYGPHGEWCVAKLGLTVQIAFVMTSGTFSLSTWRGRSTSITRALRT